MRQRFRWILALLLGPGLSLGQQTSLEYSVHADQFHVLNSAFQLELNEDRYLLEGSSHTTGLAGFFFPYRVRLWSAGVLMDDGVRPGSFGNKGSTSRSRRQVEMVYDQRGPTVVVLYPLPEDDDREPVPAGMRNGTIDPLSATVLAGRRLGGSGRCPTMPEPVFDGRRLLRLLLSPVEEPLPADLQLPREPLGAVVACRLSTEQLAGHWKGDRDGWGAGPFQRREEQREAPTVVWFARLAETMPFLPVAAERDGAWRILVKLTAFAVVTDNQ